jgi:hypothetical protein
MIKLSKKAFPLVAKVIISMLCGKDTILQTFGIKLKYASLFGMEKAF